MSRFGLIEQYLDANGNPLSGGLLYFYETGTTTAKTTYSDVGQTTPNTNPVVLDAAGRQPDIFFTGSAKVVVQSSAGVTVDTVDPVAGDTMTGAEIKTALFAESDTNNLTDTLKTKLDGIEASADVTDEANVVSALDGATLTAVTPADADKIVFQDASDSDNIKTGTVLQISEHWTGALGAVTVATGDKIVLEDASDSDNLATATASSVSGLWQDSLNAITPTTSDKIVLEDASNSDTLATATVSQVLGLGGSTDLNWDIPTIGGGASGDYEGIVATFETSSAGGGVTVTQFEPVYVSGAGTTYPLVAPGDADALGTSNIVGIACETFSNGGSGTVLLHGMIRNSGWSFTVGAAVYLSTTAGSLTETAPSGNGDAITRVGIAVEADTLYVNPGPPLGAQTV